MITAVGDSMEPTVNAGDILLLDLKQREIKFDGIYALRENDVIVPKRLQRIYDGGISVKNDNAAYEDQIVPEDKTDMLEIVGRIVWAGKKL